MSSALSRNGPNSARASYGPLPTALDRLMSIREDATIRRAAIAASLANEQLETDLRLQASYDVAEHLVIRAARLRDRIVANGNDRELHELHTFLKMAATEAIVGLVRGDWR